MYMTHKNTCEANMFFPLWTQTVGIHGAILDYIELGLV